MPRDARKPTAKTKAGRGRSLLLEEEEEVWGAYEPRGGRPECLVRSLDLMCSATGIYCGFLRQKGNKSRFEDKVSRKICSTRQTGGEWGCRLLGFLCWWWWYVCICVCFAMESFLCAKFYIGKCSTVFGTRSWNRKST